MRNEKSFPHPDKMKDISLEQPFTLRGSGLYGKCPTNSISGRPMGANFMDAHLMNNPWLERDPGSMDDIVDPKSPRPLVLL